MCIYWLLYTFSQKRISDIFCIKMVSLLYVCVYTDCYIPFLRKGLSDIFCIKMVSLLYVCVYTDCYIPFLRKGLVISFALKWCLSSVCVCIYWLLYTFSQKRISDIFCIKMVSLLYVCVCSDCYIPFLRKGLVISFALKWSPFCMCVYILTVIYLF